MKILQINCVYNNGSTGKIVYDVHSYLSEIGEDSLVVYGRLGKTDDKNVYKLCGELYSKINHALAKITGVMYGGCFFSTNKIISFIKKEKPDIVHLHCINGYFVNIYRLVGFLKKSRIKTVVTLHAEFMYTGGCGHSIDCKKWKSADGCKKCPSWKTETGSLIFDRSSTMWKRMKNAFEGFDENLIVTSVSPWLKSRAETSEILKNKKHAVVLDGIDTDIFKLSDPETSSELRNKLNLEGEKAVFHVSPAFTDDPKHLKGGYYIIELARMMPNVKFLVAGSFKENIEVPENVILLGKISDPHYLADLYSMADLSIIASSRETFSMVTAESLCCGTPVVGFKAGAPEQIALKEYAEFCDYADLQTLKLNVENFLNTSFDKSQISKTAKEKYSKEKMAKDYMNIYKTILA